MVHQLAADAAWVCFELVAFLAFLYGQSMLLCLSFSKCSRAVIFIKRLFRSQSSQNFQIRSDLAH